MLRLLMHLLGKPYEICRSCETLKIQLELVNAERKELLSTIMGLVKPEVVQVAPTITTPAIPKALSWDKRRRLLEQEDRVKASIQQRITREEKALGVEDFNALDDLSEVPENKKNATEGN